MASPSPRPGHTRVPARAIAFAPGRVNLIGEHTDYNAGLALPFAIAAGVEVDARTSAPAGWCSAQAIDLDKRDRFRITDPRPDTATGWRSFVRGTVAELNRIGVDLPGFELTISGDLPRGRGLSSSAALEVALSLALLSLAGHEPLEPLELACLCSRVENSWVGTESGLLDQLAVICATPGQALAIDFASFEMTPVPLDLAGHRLVLFDSGQEHRLSDSGYNQRRAECRRAASLLGVPSLREATAQAAAELPEPLNRRVRHILGENARVEEAVAALRHGDAPSLGRLLNASHASLRDDYDSSTPAVEATVARAWDAGAIGARMVGGGFGGGVIALLGPDRPIPRGAVPLQAGGGARLIETDAAGDVDA